MGGEADFLRDAHTPFLALGKETVKAGEQSGGISNGNGKLTNDEQEVPD